MGNHTLLHNPSMLSDDSIETYTKPTKTDSFDPTSVPRSKTLHIDYTGHLPERCETGTLYFLVACHGAFIHLEPLTGMQGPETATAITAAVEFYNRQHGVQLDTIRMDNQFSPEARAAATKLSLKWELISPYQKEPNRAERAIRTAKNHIIATRSGFHPDSPHTYLDRCLAQMELTLNLIHPFEYDPRILAYEGLMGHSYDFNLWATLMTLAKDLWTTLIWLTLSVL
jgi:hypothetical protein